MMSIVARLTFRPDQYNAGRAAHAGVWRVLQCVAWGAAPSFRARVIEEPVAGDDGVVCGWRKVLEIPVSRPYQIGVIVNPKAIIARTHG